MKRFLQWYFGSLIFSSFLLLGVLFYFGFSMDDVKTYYFELFSQLLEKWYFWLFLTIPFSLYRITQYLFHSYKYHGRMTFLRRFSFSIILPISLFYSLFNASQWYSKNEGFDYQWNFEIENKTDRAANLFAEDEMQRGMHVFGHIDTTNIQPLIKSNIEWITFVPYADQKDYDSPEVSYYHPTRNTFQNIDSMWSESIQLAHTYGFKVFLKPHVWIYNSSNGKWRSDIFPTSNENWEAWKKTYREFILLYAKIAEKNNVEMFCVGTEFTRLAIEKPNFWKELIPEIRSIYSGKLTYAANWYNEFEAITFWDQLDYIGVQAYFPLVKNNNPSINQISKGWKKHSPALKKVAEKFDKKILFTEMGYKSTPDSAIEPWSWLDYTPKIFRPVSTETQANCYEAFFNTIWKKEWFAGVHIWQWHISENTGGNNNLDFSPRKKPAENIIAKGFRKKGI